jgi:hypothetical protein
VTAVPSDGCKAPSKPGKDQQNVDACLYDKIQLKKALSLSELTDAGGLPVIDKYFYDSAKGMLFFNVVQDIPNAHGPSPLGSCPDPENQSCPEEGKESYYACPAAGCIDYVVRLNDPAYNPGPSAFCDPYPTYAQSAPTNENVLVKVGTTTPVVRVEEGGNGGNFPHYSAQDAPECPLTTPLQ